MDGAVKHIEWSDSKNTNVAWSHIHIDLSFNPLDLCVQFGIPHKPGDMKISICVEGWGMSLRCNNSGTQMMWKRKGQWWRRVFKWGQEWQGTAKRHAETKTLTVRMFGKDISTYYFYKFPTFIHIYTIYTWLYTFSCRELSYRGWWSSWKVLG